MQEGGNSYATAMPKIFNISTTIILQTLLCNFVTK